MDKIVKLLAQQVNAFAVIAIRTTLQIMCKQEKYIVARIRDMVRGNANVKCLNIYQFLVHKTSSVCVSILVMNMILMARECA